MVTEPTGVGAEPLSSAWFSLRPGQFHRRWYHRQPALPRPGALHPRLPRVAQVSADCELHCRYGRDERRSPDSPIPVHDRGLRSPHRSLSRSCCWDTTGRLPRSECRTSWPCTGSGPAAGHCGVGQRLGLQPSFDHARHVQGFDTQGVVLSDQGKADVVVRVIAQSDHPALGVVDAPLGFPPTPAAGRPARLRPLPATQSAQRVAVGLGIGIFPAA